VQEYGPGPGRSSATTALTVELAIPPRTTISPNRDARAAASS
jgi:hypothetical protein